MDARQEPWRRFEAKVDPEGQMDPAVRARKAKVAYRAFMRSIARMAVKARAAAKKRRDAAHARRIARVPTEQEMAEFASEQEESMIRAILWAASQRGERGIAGLRVRQPQVRSDRMLRHRPFTDEERAAAPPLRSRRPRPPVSSGDVAGA